MKKICFFINSDWYFKLHWVDRARAAFVEGYEIHIISNFKDKDVKDFLIKNGFICHDSKIDELSLNPFQFVFRGARVFKIIKRLKPDIIHCITIKPCLLGGLIAKSLQVPIIFSVVGLGRIFTERELKYRMLYLPIKVIYRLGFSNPHSHALFEHEADKEKLVQTLKIDSKKCTVIEGAGVDIQEFRYLPEPTHSIKKVLFAGRLLWSKGLGDLVKIKRNLKSQGKNFQLIVAGIPIPNDPDAITQEQMEIWQSDNEILWVGQSSNIHSLIAEANVVALPTYYPEGIPRILLEAASTGRAIISYDSGGCNKLLIDGVTGFLIKKNDLATFSDKLILLLEDDVLRGNMGLKGRVLVEEKFSSGIVKRKTLNLYRHLLALKETCS